MRRKGTNGKERKRRIPMPRPTTILPTSNIAKFAAKPSFEKRKIRR